MRPRQALLKGGLQSQMATAFLSDCGNFMCSARFYGDRISPSSSSPSPSSSRQRQCHSRPLRLPNLFCYSVQSSDLSDILSDAALSCAMHSP